MITAELFDICPVQPDVNVNVYTCILAELGDYDADEHLPEYVSEIKCLPQQTDVQCRAIAAIHKTLVYDCFAVTGTTV